MTSMYLLHLDEAFGEIKNVNQEEHLLGYSLSSSPDFDELFTWSKYFTKISETLNEF